MKTIPQIDLNYTWPGDSSNEVNHRLHFALSVSESVNRANIATQATQTLPPRIQPQYCFNIPYLAIIDLVGGDKFTADIEKIEDTFGPTKLVQPNTMERLVRCISNFKRDLNTGTWDGLMLFILGEYVDRSCFVRFQFHWAPLLLITDRVNEAGHRFISLARHYLQQGNAPIEKWISSGRLT